MLTVQGNLAMSYQELGRLEEALRTRQEVYSGRLKLNGKEHESTLRAAFNYANSLEDLKRFEEAKTLSRKMIPVARRALGESHPVSLGMRWLYARLLFEDAVAPLANIREAVSRLEEMGPTARRVFGGVHPLTKGVERALLEARAALRARETQSTAGSS